MLRTVVLLLCCALTLGIAVWMSGNFSAGGQAGVQEQPSQQEKQDAQVKPGPQGKQDLEARLAGGSQNVEVYGPVRLAPEPIRALKDVPIVTAAESPLADNELVIGCVINGAARAWAINQLTGHKREIINDELGGRSIAATW